jgi:phosphoribosylamine--glycine ligase
MVREGDPYVIEYNCRFGDPETQAILPLIESSLLDAFLQVAREGRLSIDEFAWSERAAVCTVLASGGYPGDYKKGKEIEIPAALGSDPDLIILHAGTRRDPEGRLVTGGGRVLGVVGLGDDVTRATQKSVAGAEAVQFEGKYFRRDIGYREVERERSR